MAVKEESKKTKTLAMKKTEQWKYLENILKREVKKLENDKDLDSFFELIGFEDNNNFIKSVYDITISMLKEKNSKSAKLNYKNIHNAICNAAYKIVYGGNNRVSISEVYDDLRGSIKNWLERKHPDYVQYIGKSIQYDIFIEFLIKHTVNK